MKKQSWVLVTLLSVLSGCYTSEDPTPYKCSQQKKGCPEGFTCDPRKEECVKDGTNLDVSVDGPGEDAGKDMSADAGGDMGEDMALLDTSMDAGKDKALLDAAIIDQPLADQKIVPDQVVHDSAVPDRPIPDVTVPDLPIPDLPIPDQMVPDQVVPDQGVVVPATWVTIQTGTFQMGSPDGTGTQPKEPCRNTIETQHQVTLTNDFEIQTTEVTQNQFYSLMGYKPSHFSACGGTCPVEQVNWHEAAAYANALSAKAILPACYTCTGSGKAVTCQEASVYSGQKVYSCRGYRLPTEAEWEYAYRAVTSTALYNGGITSCTSKDPNMDKIGWYSSNSNSKTHPVGQKTPNAWGLTDMAGNVREWCHDLLGTYPSSSVTDPVGMSGTSRVFRGGSWKYNAAYARAANRNNSSPGYSRNDLGFRPVRTLSPPGTWVTIKAGTFQMGSPTSPIPEPCRSSDETQHQVVLTNTFKMMTTEVTQGQFKAVMGYSPSYFSLCGSTCPVETVSWHEAAAYANALSEKVRLSACYACTGSGKTVICQEAPSYAGKKIYACPGYRLPTEAEWEYAYRAGTSTAFYNGGVTSCTSQDPNAEKIGWYDMNSSAMSHPTGQKTANAWGLFDMAGNVWEWCHDWYQGSYGSSAVTDPVGLSSPHRVVRGGAWDRNAGHARGANRNAGSPDKRYSYFGFRLARTLAPLGTWVTITAGTFQMGSPDGTGTQPKELCRANTETPHTVTLTRMFEISTKEVTQGQFSLMMGYNPSSFSNCGPSCPVEMVNWHEATAYANALSAMTGFKQCYTCTGKKSSVSCMEVATYAGTKIYACPGYRLPTEAEWEYAYRAGTTTVYYNGGITTCTGQDANLEKIGWYNKNSSNKTYAAGQKTANAWGLYDVAGNVWEWCHDWHGTYPSSSVTDPAETSGTYRVYRGGSWIYGAGSARAAYRYYGLPGYRLSSIGFRPVRSVP